MRGGHELIERGFDVDVYEQHPQLGGKCRNYPLPGTGTDGRPDLFGTCGGHFFFGAYPNLGQTLGRIPLEGGGTVLDNLTTLTNQHGYISLMAFPELTLYLPELSPSALFAAIRGKNFLKIARGWLMLLRKLGIRDSIILESKVLALVTTGEKRRWQQLEHTGLSQFLRTDKLGSTAAQVGHLPKLLFSFSETEDANTRVAATWLTQSISAALGEYGPGFTKAVAMLAGPEAQMWFDPWELHLTSLGVRFHKERAVTPLAVADGRIDSATVVDPEGNSVEVDADWFVLALPPSKANELVNPELLHVAPELGQLSEVPSARMGDWLDSGGLLLFLKHRVSELGALNIGGLKPWALICEPLSSRWRVDLTKYGDGTAVEYVTLQMAHLESLLGESGIKPISHSSKEEITNVALAMLRINIPGGERIFAD